ncbi:hypothetical protein LXL04_010689 [Taraxacum kok-saghyz]
MSVCRCAVVTGANKGIGFEICKQLASNGVKVVLTARNQKRGIDAIEKFKGTHLSDLVIFHQLDVMDPASVASLAQFVKTQFGKLDILVNNSGIGGVTRDEEALNNATGTQIDWNKILIQSHELAVQCLETNYYGAKRMVEHFIPLLESSNSPRIVNVSSSMGKLKDLKNEFAKGILSDVDNLTEEKIDQVLNGYLNDFKEGLLESKGWPNTLSAYMISKAAMNGYTRILAKKYTRFCINCVCPGFVKTDINYNRGILSTEDGAETPVKIALLPEGGPSGCFFDRNGKVQTIHPIITRIVISKIKLRILQNHILRQYLTTLFLIINPIDYVTVCRYALVTGANKGIGFEICKQLASNGVKVVLTARDQKRGIDAIEKFKETNLSDLVIFHQLDVMDPASVASLAQFVKTQFGKLDILVNNSGISGVTIDEEAFRMSGAQIDWSKIPIQSHELAVQCLETNYYGAKRMVEHFIPLLESSNSPRIVNVSSSLGKLKGLKNEWAKGILSDVENLTEEKIDQVLNEYLNDFKDGLLETKGWPTVLPTYVVSKAALNGYTRILAKKHTRFCINCVCPGAVKTDINYNTGTLSVEEGAETPVKMALLPEGGPSGCFFDRNGMHIIYRKNGHTSKVSMAADTASTHPPEPYNKANEH